MKSKTKQMMLLSLAVLVVVTTTNGQTVSNNNNNTTSYESDVNRRMFNLTSGLFISSPVRVINRIVDRLVGVPYGEWPKLFEKPVEYRF